MGSVEVSVIVITGLQGGAVRVMTVKVIFQENEVMGVRR